MAHYGQLFTPQTSSNDEVYKIFISYYNNPAMTKTRDTDKHSVYMTRIHSLLANTQKYLIAMVHKDNISIGTEKNMNQLDWDVFQTRSLVEKHKMKPFFYTPARGTPLDDSITRISESKESVEYTAATLPLKVMLLNTPNMPHKYTAEGSLVLALETYQTVITFK